jgi:hypothetical protein
MSEDAQGPARHGKAGQGEARQGKTPLTEMISESSGPQYRTAPGPR